MRHPLLATLLSLCACSQTADAPVAVSLSETDTLLVAHRGASHVAPENTLAAFRLAWEQGADAIEADFRLTADSQVVCVHDDTWQRTANDRRRVRDLTLAQATALDAGSWKHPDFADERPPSLGDVLAALPIDGHLFIELKAGPAIVPPTLAALDAADAPLDHITLLAFDADVIAAIEQQRPELNTAWLVSWKRDTPLHAYRPRPDDVLATLNRIGADGLDCMATLEVLTPPFAQRLRDAGYDLHCWTVDSPDKAARLLALGVDSITTNRPQHLRDHLD